jgi:EAL domain-containing protein (putative c-di-GMP-specific phosphodiesterase class I)
MDVVAEGIETEPEARFLRGLRCRYGQGYLYARPLPAEQIEALLRGPPLSGPPPAAGEPPAQGA